jgi:hypothetical protein
VGQDGRIQHQAVPSPPVLATGWFVLLWTAWVPVPAGLVIAALGSLLTFFGELPTDAERADARRLLVLAAVVAVAIPVVGLVLALRIRRRGSATAFGCALAVGVVAGLVLIAGTAPRVPRSAVPTPRPGGACQEHSGGDTRCPGG